MREATKARLWFLVNRKLCCGDVATSTRLVDLLIRHDFAAVRAAFITSLHRRLGRTNPLGSERIARSASSVGSLHPVRLCNYSTRARMFGRVGWGPGVVEVLTLTRWKSKRIRASEDAAVRSRNSKNSAVHVAHEALGQLLAANVPQCSF